MLSPVVLTVINNALLPQNTQSFFMIVRRQGFTDATLQNYLLAANHAKSAKKKYLLSQAWIRLCRSRRRVKYGNCIIPASLLY